MKSILISIFAVSLLLGCSKKLENLQKDDVIVAFGDSLTYGYGANKEDAYPEQLSKLTNYKVINAGLNGDTAANGKIRIQEMITEYHSKAVILSLGGMICCIKIPLI